VSEVIPSWTVLPFTALVLSMASLPLAVPHFWERRSFQALVVAGCTLPVVAFLSQHGLQRELGHSVSGYITFITTLGALYVAAGGVASRSATSVSWSSAACWRASSARPAPACW
jgi:hypothetical protein